VDDGNRTRAINLKLKKDKKKGMFGRVGAGVGTDGRYESRASVSYFKGASKLSLVARSNNINSIGFTQGDITGVGIGGGGNNNSAASAPGITRNNNAGLNYSDLWGKKTEVTGSYFFNNSNTTNTSSSYRQTFFADSTLNRSQLGNTGNRSTNHRLNMRLTYNIDSFNSVIYTPNVQMQQSESERLTNTITSSLKNGTELRENENNANISNEGRGSNWSNNLLYRHRFARRGRTLSINLSNTWSTNDRNGLTDSRFGFYNQGIKWKDSLVQQINRTDNGTNNYGLNASYT